MKTSLAVVAIASSLATAGIAVPATYTICHTFTRTVTKVKRVPAKPTPPRVVYRDRVERVLIEAPCVPMSLATPPEPNLTYNILDSDIPELAGVSTAAPRLFPISRAAPPPVLISGPPAAAVPEPATWGMFILGFGIIGGALRSSRALSEQKS
jgi:hypothetical protein